MTASNEIQNFSSLDLPNFYVADEGVNLNEDIYTPILCNSIAHDRLTYGFSAQVLLSLVDGIEGLISNGGKMRLIIGQPLTDKEDKAIKEGTNDLKNGHEHFCMRDLYKLIEEKKSSRENYALGLLSNLIGAGKLEIKFAFKLVASIRPYQHSKISIFGGVNNEEICWQGSGNFSNNASEAHFETFSIYHSTRPEGGYPIQGPPIKNTFKKMWHGEIENWDVVTVPDEFYQTWKKAFKKTNNSDIEKALAAIRKKIREKKERYKSFDLRKHQEKAITNWWKNDKKGILDHATGSGKTYTAIRAIYALRKEIKQLNVVIAVPFIPLADQWMDELNDYFNNIKEDKFIFNGVIGCYTGQGNWKDKLKVEANNLTESLIDKTGHLSITLVVNRTFLSDSFQEVFRSNRFIKQNRLMFIGDECHNFSTKGISDSLNDNAVYRLGLSATAFNDEDHKTKGELAMQDYFGDICDRYTLKQGIDDGHLCNYYYHPRACYLSIDEYHDWKEYVGSHKPVEETFDQDSTPIENMESIIDNSKEKYSSYLSLIKERSFEKKHTITFVGQGKVNQERSIDHVSSELEDNNWTFQRITFDEDRKHRKNTIKGFGRGDIESICAIRVLDEGIDIPQIKTAIILASSNKRRQFIQRRGRVLRSHEDKKHANIYDFIILPPPTFRESGKDLIVREMNRVKEMGQDALNQKEIKEFINKYEGLYGTV